ncbi:MAG: 30S ribosomal protein S6 [Clostridia bacterium]|nr:30S ribosomal protein S6 [Clostridia bacterium]
MNKYEALYILDTACADEERDGLIAKFENVVVNSGGVVEKSDKWGVKKLAYPINYKSEGFYVLMSFESDPNAVQELNRVMGISENVMRSMITKL